MPDSPDLLPAKKKPTGRPPRQYTEEQRDLALLALAEHNGHHYTAARFLKEHQGINIDHRLLRQWAEERHTDRYLELQREYVAVRHARLAGQYEEMASKAMRVVEIAIDQAQAQLEAGEAKDPAGVARNLTTVAGISTDKLLPMRDRPNQITEHRNADEIIRQLERLGVVDATAEDITDQ